MKNIKDLFKNRVVLGSIAIITALIICFAIAPLFSDSLSAKATVIRMNKNVAKGEQIQASMVSSVEVGGYNLPGDIITNEDEIVGKYATVDLMKNDYLNGSKLSVEPISKNEYLTNLDQGEMVISFTIKSFAKGLSGKLEQGDLISLIVLDELEQSYIPDSLKYVEVVAITGEDGIDQNKQYMNREEENEEEEPAITISVIANEYQAKEIAKFEEISDIHVALTFRGGIENKKLYLDIQNEMITKLEEAAALEENASEEQTLEESIPEETSVNVADINSLTESEVVDE